MPKLFGPLVPFGARFPPIGGSHSSPERSPRKRTRHHNGPPRVCVRNNCAKTAGATTISPERTHQNAPDEKKYLTRPNPGALFRAAAICFFMVGWVCVRCYQPLMPQFHKPEITPSKTGFQGDPNLCADFFNALQISFSKNRTRNAPKTGRCLQIHICKPRSIHVRNYAFLSIRKRG